MAPGKLRGALHKCRNVVLRNVVGIAAARAVFELQIFEVPALRAVFERVDGIGNAKIDQRLRADNAAGAAGAVDHDGGVRPRRERMSAQRQFAVGAADAARDAHLLVFRKRTAVQHDQVVAAALTFGQFAGADAGGVENLFGQFAEGLAGHVDARECRVAITLPLRQPARQSVHVCVAQRGQCARSTRRSVVIAAVVVDDNAHATTRRKTHDVDFEPAVRHRRGVEEMGLAILAMFAHVQQRDLAAIVQPLLERMRIDAGGLLVVRGLHHEIRRERRGWVSAARPRSRSAIRSSGSSRPICRRSMGPLA